MNIIVIFQTMCEMVEDTDEGSSGRTCGSKRKLVMKQVRDIRIN